MIPFSDEDLFPPVRNIIKTRIAPAIQRDGGDISLIDIIDARIFIQLQGACVGCSSSSSTLKFIVEKELKEAIHPELQIINVPHGMEDRIQEL